jgi:hypothetical protein
LTHGDIWDRFLTRTTGELIVCLSWPEPGSSAFIGTIAPQ